MKLLFINGSLVLPNDYKIGEDEEPHIYGYVPIPANVCLVDTEKNVSITWKVEYVDEYLRSEPGSLCTRGLQGTQVRLVGKTINAEKM